MSTTIRINRETKNKLENIGNKGETFDDIINKLYHERNILAIHEICKNMNEYDNTTIYKVFDSIEYIIPPAPIELNLKNENWHTHNNYEDAQKKYREHVFEIATDEDFIGHNREPPVSEVITNIYCLFENITAPTWSNNLGLKNPFIRFRE